MRVCGLPTTQVDLSRLLRDVKVIAVLYTARHGKELRVVKAATLGNVRVIDTPTHLSKTRLKR